MALNGYDVIMTRTEDIGTEDDSAAPIRYRKVSDLKNRLNLMNSYDDAIFVSIHLNKFTASNVHGAQVFYSKNNEQSKKLGLCIQNSVKSLLQNNNDRAIKEGNKSTYLLYNAKIPAVIVECGFLSNKSELALLKNEEYQQKMAFSIFCGVAEYMS